MYGPVDGMMDEQTPWNPLTAMGEARAQTARLFTEAIEKGRIKGLIARSADFYGHGTPNAFTNRLVFERILLCDLDQPHSLTYLPDIGRALEALAHATDSWNQTWGWFAPVMKEVRATCYQFDRPYLFDSSKFERHFFEATDYHDGIREIATQCR